MFFVECSCGAKSKIQLTEAIDQGRKGKEIVVDGEVDIVIGDYELLNVYCSSCETELKDKEKNS
ncbi:hypothetical protein [Bacillus cereus]|uniref:hypothetical protein n=1 Tax=Bacillus cereus TaxID=1396 RepID=UPI000B4BB15F|nr:hypothetical protein [Bacillus cereus]